MTIKYRMWIRKERTLNIMKRDSVWTLVDILSIRSGLKDFEE